MSSFGNDILLPQTSRDPLTPSWHRSHCTRRVTSSFDSRTKIAARSAVSAPPPIRIVEGTACSSDNQSRVYKYCTYVLLSAHCSCQTNTATSTAADSLSAVICCSLKLPPSLCLSLSLSAAQSLLKQQKNRKLARSFSLSHSLSHLSACSHVYMTHRRTCCWRARSVCVNVPGTHMHTHASALCV